MCPYKALPLSSTEKTLCEGLLGEVCICAEPLAEQKPVAESSGERQRFIESSHIFLPLRLPSSKQSCALPHCFAFLQGPRFFVST